MTVFVTVTNKEENAYNARLIVTFLSDLRYIGLDKVRVTDQVQWHAFM